MPRLIWKGFAFLLFSCLIQWDVCNLYAGEPQQEISISNPICFEDVVVLHDTVPTQVEESAATDSVDQSIPDSVDRSEGAFVKSFTHWIETRARAAQKYYARLKSPDASRSALYSALLPGAGQVYNRQSWKLGLVWGGIGFTMYNLDANISQYRRFRDAYELSVMGVEHELSFLSENALKSYRDQFRSNLELNYIALGAIYIFNILEAFVSGHLAGFDVSDDLSIRFPPGDQVAPLQMSCVYTF